MIYCDPALHDALPEGEYDAMMRGCLTQADELNASGSLLDSQQLEAPATARTLRVRNQHASVVDGPFAERSEEHTSELQSLMRISYAVFCLNKKKKTLQK